MKQAESSFSPELQKKAVISGKDWGWKFEDVPAVIAECLKHNYAILGGEAQFCFPDNTCELFWLSADPIKFAPGENWEVYCRRSSEAFMEMFDYLVKVTDFKKEGLKNFPFLEEKAKAGVNILDHLYFFIYPTSRENYPDLPESRVRH